MIEANLRKLIRRDLFGFRRRTFAKNGPGTGALDRLRIDLLPVGEVSQKSHLIAIGLSVPGQWDTQKQIAVLADDIDQERNDERGFLVGVVLKVGTVVVPTPDASLGLPWFFLKRIRQATFRSRG